MSDHKVRLVAQHLYLSQTLVVVLALAGPFVALLVLAAACEATIVTVDEVVLTICAECVVIMSAIATSVEGNPRLNCIIVLTRKITISIIFTSQRFFPDL